jgi:hypothetical protein
MRNHAASALPITMTTLILTTWSRSRGLPQRLVLRALIVLMAAEGVANEYG